MEHQIFFNDGSIVAGYAKTNRNNQYELYGVDEVIGMGNATYKKVVPYIFEELFVINTFYGIAMVFCKHRGLWGLIIFRDPRNKGDDEIYKNVDRFWHLFNLMEYPDFTVNHSNFFGDVLTVNEPTFRNLSDLNFDELKNELENLEHKFYINHYPTLI